MPKFCANLTMLFNEHAFLERFAAAARAGFKGVEYLFPYPFPKGELVERLKKNGLTQVLHNLPAGDWAGAARCEVRVRGIGVPRLRRLTDSPSGSLRLCNPRDDESCPRVPHSSKRSRAQELVDRARDRRRGFAFRRARRMVPASFFRPAASSGATRTWW